MASSNPGEETGSGPTLNCSVCQQPVPFSGAAPNACPHCGHALDSRRLAETVDAPVSPETLRRRCGHQPLQAVVGNYGLIRELGHGGMGAVYEAEHLGTSRRAAIKVLPAGVVRTPVELELFRREGRLAARIRHSRCVFVYEADEHEGQPYIVMELMTGETLEDVVARDGPQTPKQAIASILDVVDGLIAAHRLGIIHRDVKPSNCYLDSDGRVKIGDFGLSKSLEGDYQISRTTAYRGTPLYSSPEQFRGERLDRRTDVYSVSATIHFLLTGRAPFEADTYEAAIAHIASTPLPSMRRQNREVSRRLEAVVRKGLEKDRERRWTSLEEFRDALLQAAPGRQEAPAVGVRVGAFLIDFALLSAVEFVFSLSLNDWSARFGAFVVLILYFACLEGLTGTSFGKWATRLRVVDTSSLGPPGVLRAGLRALIVFAFYLPCEAGFWLTPEDDSGSYVLAFFLWQILYYPLPAVLLLSTMRRGSGMRGPHELMTRTRVIKLRTRAFRPAIESDEGFLPSALAHTLGEMPARLGPFTILGEISTRPSRFWLLAEDVNLRRNVWIRLGASGVSHARQDCLRPSRLVWLEEGSWERGTWQAFLSPEGRSLVRLIEQQGSLSWAELRTVLGQLTQELSCAIKEGTLPDVLTVDQVWIDDGGMIQLLDEPLEEPLHRRDGLVSHEQRVRELLADAVCLSAQGNLELNAEGHWIQGRIPLHARALVQGLVDAKNQNWTLTEFSRELSSIEKEPAQVEPSSRVGQFGIATATLLPLCLLFLAVRFVAIAASADELADSILQTEALLAAIEVPEVRAGLLRDLEEEVSEAGNLERTAIRRNGALSQQRARLRSHLASRFYASAFLNDSYRTDDELKQRRQLALDEDLKMFVSPDAGASVDSLTFLAYSANQDTEKRITFTKEELQETMLEVFSPVNEAYVVLVITLILSTGIIVWFTVSAGFFQGGFSYFLSGICVVRRSGRQAWRLHCMLRCAVLWAVLLGIVNAIVCLDCFAIGWPWLGTTGCLLLVLAFALAFVLAVRYPERSWNDLLVGTYLIPR